MYTVCLSNVYSTSVAQKFSMWIFFEHLFIYLFICWLIDSCKFTATFNQFHIEMISHFFCLCWLKRRMIAYRYFDSIHMNWFTCIWLLHVIQSHCEWHRLVDSNVWMTWPIFDGFPLSFVQCQVGEKTNSSLLCC